MANDKETGFMTALSNYMNENPEAVNVGLGLLGSFQDDARRKGLAQDAIARTQYGYLLGQGPGDISKAMSVPSAMDRMLRGFARGHAQRRNTDLQKKIFDILEEKKVPFRKPAAIKPEPVVNRQVPSEIINSQSEGMSSPVKGAEGLQSILSGTEDAPFMSVERKSSLPQKYKDIVDRLGVFGG